ncbi:MAG TPA: ABC transporter permease [Fastidiosipila sp.]|jgi:ABC-type uncharacterized transport system permease subunit|nr:ABC transporter permease [Fastidiosipila sp.]
MPDSNRRGNPLLRFFGNQRWQFITIPLVAILMSLITASIIVLILGKNPLTTFQSLLQGSGFIPKPNYANFKNVFTDFVDTVDAVTPMIFASLAVAVAFHAGLFNIGVSGQMLLSGFVATIVVGYSPLPAVLAKPLVIIIGIIVGALVGGLIGFLKYRFNINEVVAAIMLNYIIQYTISFFINTRYVDPVSRQSRVISSASRLTLLNVPYGDIRMRIPIAFVIAILLAIFLWFFFAKMKPGFEMKMVGLNQVASRYAGVRIGKTLIMAMMISGALAGLAGVSYYLGFFSSIQPNVLTSVGFDAIAVSLLGNSHPIGVIFSSWLITALSRGGTYMSSMVGIRYEIAALIVGLILLFSAMSQFIRQRINALISRSDRR